MADLSYIIDPAGDASRPGINLQVFPSGETPLDNDGVDLATTRLANNELAAGDFNFRYEFDFDTVLTLQNYGKLEGLIKLLRSRVNSLGQWEVVLYNLAEPFSEISTSRSRYMVPGTTVITQENLGDGMYYWEYWVAIQGALSIRNKKRYGAHYETTLEFTEGTLLTSTMET